MALRSQARIYVAGHQGLVGSAIVRALEAAGHSALITRTHRELDLTDARATERFFTSYKPEIVFLAAAKVGGIEANRTTPADFIRINQQIQLNVIDAAYRHGVQKLLMLGSSCVYPKHAPQPLKEEHLLTGPLEATSAPYAVAKISGLVMCDSYNRQYGTNFVAAMPCNLYGPGDNFDLVSGHVVPAIMRRFHEAKLSGASKVTLWGSGAPRRELLFVDDVARACVLLMDRADAGDGPMWVNVGSGEDMTIREIAERIKRVVGYAGAIAWDSSMPDGTPRKLLDVSRMRALGWSAATPLDEGLQRTYDWFLQSPWSA